MTARWLSALTTPQKLALLVFVLGAVAVFGDPYRSTGKVTIDSRQLAAIVGSEVDHVTPAELAGWIISGRSDYRLLDLRDAADYAAYHVPTAENAPIASLPDYPLARNEKVVLYSDGGIHAAQGWFLLKAAGFPAAYILLGGLDAWEDEVLFPTASQEGAAPTAEETAALARRAEVAAFFGGAPRGAAAAGADGAAEVELPRVVAPPPVVAAPAATAKKKKEGC